MRTTYRIREPYASIFLQCAKDAPWEELLANRINHPSVVTPSVP